VMGPVLAGTAPGKICNTGWSEKHSRATLLGAEVISRRAGVFLDETMHARRRNALCLNTDIDLDVPCMQIDDSKYCFRLLDEKVLCPGVGALERINASLR
jgi:hypothetical protein